MAWRETDEAPFKKYRNPKNATGYHTDAKCCHADVKWSDYARLRFSLHHGRLKQPLRVQWITPLPTISCHLIANPLFQANNGFTLQAKRRTISKYNKYGSSNHFKKQV